MARKPSSETYPESVRWGALRMIVSGKTLEEAARRYKLPVRTVHYWVEKYPEQLARIERERMRNREAFNMVADRYNDILSILGNPGAMDYSHITGGSGAQYAPDKGLGFLMIDFTVDVDNAVRATLTDEQQVFWAEKIRLQDYDLTVQTEEFVELQELLGSEFIARGLFPVSEYFGDVKPKPTLVPFNRRGTKGAVA